MSDTVIDAAPAPEADNAPRKPGRPFGSKKRVMARNVVARKARPRTESDAAEVGVGGDPRPAERASPAREEGGHYEKVTRIGRSERQATTLDLPLHRKKTGWDYEWKTARVLGQNVDRSEGQVIRRAGWRPEVARDWPELSDPGAPPDEPIELEGQRLYGRPMTLTREARQEDHQFALEQQRDRTMAAASGKSAVRGHEGMGAAKGVRTVPGGLEIEGLAG